MEGIEALEQIVPEFNQDASKRFADDPFTFCGDAGYMVGSPVERMYRDVKIMQIYEGANEIQEMVISRALMREYGNVTP